MYKANLRRGRPIGPAPPVTGTTSDNMDYVKLNTCRPIILIILLG